MPSGVVEFSLVSNCKFCMKNVPKLLVKLIYLTDLGQSGDVSETFYMLISCYSSIN